MTVSFFRPQLARLIGQSAAGVSPTWQTAPAITNATLKPGDVVTYSTGTPTGYPNPTTVYQVLVDGAPQAVPYTVQSDDVGKTIKVRGIAANDIGGPINSDSAGVVVQAANTLLSSRRLGNQVGTLLDWSPDAATVDLMGRARNLAPTSGGGSFAFSNDEHVMLAVQSLTRSGGSTVSVVLAYAPEAFLKTGMRVVLQCMTDSTFDVPDGAVITVTDQTHFTYTKAGANGAAPVPSSYDCPASVINTVACGSNGHPIEDFYVHLCSLGGMTDLSGTYTVHFAGSVPTTVSFGGATLTGSGATRTLVISGSTGSISMQCDGVANDGSFLLPTIIRNDHDQSGATLLRPDFRRMQARFGVQRTLGLGSNNFNSNVQGWGSRPVVTCGRGMTLQDQVRFFNEVGCDMYFVIPTMATDDYVTNALTYIRDNLLPGLKVYLEWSNEVWNSFTYPHWHWFAGVLRRKTKAVYHGATSNEVVSISRSGSTVTVTLNRAPPFSSGANVWMRIVSGSAGYDTAAGGATATVSGNSFSFTNTGSASGAASFSQVTIYGDTSSPLVSGSDGNLAYTMILRTLALRTYEMAQIASAVFGGLMTRARPVLMWQHVQFGAVRVDTLPWLQGQFGPVKNWLWAIGGAPYSKAAGSNSTPAQVRDSVISYCDSTCDDWQHYIRFTATKYELRLINYEGGIDLTDLGSNHTLIDSLYSAPEIRTASRHLVDHAFGFGADLSLQLNSSMTAAGTDGGSAWGIGRTLAADGGEIGTATCEKLKGIDDALQASLPPIIDPNKLPGTLQFIGGSTYKDNQAGYQVVNGMHRQYDNANSIEEYVFYSDGTAPIVLTCWGRIVVGGGGNGERCYLDGTLVGTFTLQTTTGDLTNGASGGLASTNTVTITPTEGWHLIALRPPASQPDHVGVSKLVGV